MRAKPTPILETREVNELAVAVEEAARAANVENPRFVEPLPGTLSRAKSRRHNIVFGRRGSGKTSLLAKAAAELTVDRRPIAFVDLEAFKGHSYPDVLLSVLIRSFAEFKEWFDRAATTPASKTTFWRRLFGSKPSRPPLDRSRSQAISRALGEKIDELREELHKADESSRQESREESQSERTKGSAGAKVGHGALQASAETLKSEDTGQRQETVEISRRSKEEFLHRHILEYERLFREVARAAEGDAFLFLDDLYHIRRADQARVIDYFHRVAKQSRLWLKIGTIRHRTSWYRHSDPPIGLKLGDDAEEIDLDLTLEKYQITKRFLTEVLNEIAQSVGVSSINAVLAPTAIERLVVASGGVARDFLALFRRSIDVARERGGGARGPRIAAQDVNQAAGELDATKRDELKRDTLEERESIEQAFDKVKEFCLGEKQVNCFLIEKDRNDVGTDLIEELVDLRLLHLVQSRVTVWGRAGKLYEAYMLDLGQYTGERKRRNLEMIQFWDPTSKDRLRRAGLVYEPWQPEQ